MTSLPSHSLVDEIAESRFFAEGPTLQERLHCRLSRMEQREAMEARLQARLLLNQQQQQQRGQAYVGGGRGKSRQAAPATAAAADRAQLRTERNARVAAATTRKRLESASAARCSHW